MSTERIEPSSEYSNLLWVIENSHPMWTLYVGQPETGHPIQLSSEAVKNVKEALRIAHTFVMGGELA